MHCRKTGSDSAYLIIIAARLVLDFPVTGSPFQSNASWKHWPSPNCQSKGIFTLVFKIL